MRTIEYTPRIVLISAERRECAPHVNAERTAELERILIEIGLQYKPILGVYGGTEERSFAIVAETNPALLYLIDLANRFNQESILVSNEDRSTYLIYLADHSVQHLPGKLHGVTLTEARKYSSYSIETDYSQAYVVA